MSHTYLGLGHVGTYGRFQFIGSSPNSKNGWRYKQKQKKRRKAERRTDGQGGRTVIELHFLQLGTIIVCSVWAGTIIEHILNGRRH